MKSNKIKLFLAFALFFAHAVIYAQNVKIDLTLNSVSLNQFIGEIEKKTDYTFMLDNTIDKTQRISVNAKNQTLSAVLTQAFNPTKLSWKIIGKQIILKLKDAVPAGNTKTITGTVLDEKNEPIIGASVAIKGTTKGAVTDIDGNFSLEAAPGETLAVSYVGYLPKEIAVNNQSVYKVIVAENTKALDEVVVVGYGTKRKGDITSAVSVIDMDNIGDLPAVDASRLIQGQAAGVAVKQTTGAPGREMEITVRGLGSLGAGSAPLYVIDGFPVGTSMQQSLNPNDIESISILKDAASTSIYGARGSNGVILITTKRAKEGELKLTATASFGIQNVPNSRRVQMMNGQEFAQFKKESFIDKYIFNNNREPSIDEIPIDYRYPEKTAYSTDWFDKIINNNALTQNYNVTLSEGKGNIKTVLSLGYVNQQGAVIQTNFERFNARLNLDGKINEYITLGWNLAASRSHERLIDSDGRGSVIGQSLTTDPRQPVYKEDGSWNAYLGGHDGIFGQPNPVMYLHEVSKKQQINRIISNGYVEITFLKDFKFKPSVNVSLLDLSRRDFIPSTIGGENNPPPRDAQMYEWDQKTTNYNVDLLLTYAKKIGDHSMDAMVGYTAQEENWNEMRGEASKFPNDEIWMLQNGEKNKVTNGRWAWSLLAYMARANYSYKDKYLVSASFRREGSSRFGVDNRWGNFPSVSLGWRLTEESFMPKFWWLNNLKLRGSYGVTGNNNIGNYTSLAGMSNNNYILGGNFAPGSTISSFANARLGWEKSNSLDLGLDLSLFDNKLGFVLEYYNRLTTSMLLPKDIPIITGFPSTFTNLGEVRNRGVEASIDYKTAVTKDFNLRGNFNITFNSNKVLAIEGKNDYIETFNMYNIYNRSQVGRPVSMLYGYKVLGIFNSWDEINNAPAKQEGAIPGVYRYLDADGNKEITYDTKDMVEIGNPHPKFIWAFTLGGNYRHFDFNILFTGAQGYDLMRNIEATTTNMDGVFNVLKEAKDRWRSAENPGKGKIPTSNTWKWEREVNSRYVYDASHAWLKSISLGYTIPKSSAILKGARFYLNAENLFLFTNYPGSNPDVNTNGNTNGGDINIGRDDEAYPVPLILTLGTVLTF